MHKLTIAIPTYNRSHRLKENLPVVLDQSKGKDVNIIISDNASTDDTKQYIETLLCNHKELSYYRNKSNLSFDGNFKKCFELAEGEYVWILSDDDTILPGTVDYVLQMLDKNPVYICLNFANYSKDNQKRISKPAMPGNGEYSTNDKNKILHDIGIFLTFCSISIYKTNLIKRVDMNKFVGNPHIFGYVLELLRNPGDYIVTRRVCIASSVNNTVSYDVYKVWCYQYPKLLYDLGKECGFDHNNLNNQIEYDLNHSVLNYILKFRRTCSNEHTWEKHFAFAYADQFPRLKWKYHVAVNTPKFLLFFVEKTFTLIRKATT